MSKPLLSILIPTVIGREKELGDLLNKILKNYTVQKSVAVTEKTKMWWYYVFGPEIEVLICEDDKEMTIGQKRGLLYKNASSDYSWQIDDDDSIAPDAISKILQAIELEPDCITFHERCIIDGIEYKSNHSHQYPDWDGNGQHLFSDGFHYHRTPFFKSVIKTSIAQSVPIPHKRFGEDHDWAKLLKPHLHSEVHIPEELYIYQHTSSNFTERYGLDRT